jgi:hypothetical protein
LLLLLNYGKALSYLHCRIEALLDNIAHCDCEKQVADSTDMNQTDTTQKINFKEKIPDTVFTTLKSISYHQFVIGIFSNNNSTNRSSIASGFLSIIFQPPRA